MKRIISFFLCVLLCALLMPTTARAFGDPRQDAAAELMARCEEVLVEARRERLPDFDERLDPENTGLVGEEFTLMVTTPGRWCDKRISARPSMAGAVAGYLIEAGAKAGDTIAVNTSGSYPGFLIATLCAARALELDVLLACSYGTSVFGATMPEFTIPVMLDALRDAGLLDVRPDAISPGGKGDAMESFLLDDPRPVIAALMAERPERTLTGTFAENLEVRREIFMSRPVAAFVNCGCSASSVGHEDAFPLPPHGLIRSLPKMPTGNERGLVYDFLERGVPVIHLLYTKGVCEDWGLPFEEFKDPQF